MRVSIILIVIGVMGLMSDSFGFQFWLYPHQLCALGKIMLFSHSENRVIKSHIIPSRRLNDVLMSGALRQGWAQSKCPVNGGRPCCFVHTRLYQGAHAQAWQGHAATCAHAYALCWTSSRAPVHTLHGLRVQEPPAVPLSVHGV